MQLHDDFDRRVNAANRILRDRGGLPLINYAGFDMFEQLDLGWTCSWEEPRSVSLLVPPYDPDDSCERFVALNFVWCLRKFEGFLRLSPEDEAERVGGHLKPRKSGLSSTPVLD